MAYEQLSVSGIAIRPSVPRCPAYLPTRKFYNAKYFHDDRYRHEIANHYRDFKRRPRLRRRKRGLLSYTYGKPVLATIREMPYEYLPELPMAVQELPRFEKEYTPRGRRRLCDEKRQDLVCNNTLKRIQKARADNDIEFLKSCARRHLERLQRVAPKTEGRTTRNAVKIYQSLEKCEKCHNSANNLPKSNKFIYPRILGRVESVEGLANHHLQQQLQTARPHQRRRPQEFPFANECDCGVTLPFQKRRNFVSLPPENYGSGCGGVGADKANTTTLTYYLQLATDYYEQGFLNNIKYLQNVGERNQVRHKRLQQQLRHSTSTADCTNNNYCSAVSIPVCENRIPNASSKRPQQTSDAVVDSEDDCCHRSSICNPILKIIAKKRSFRIYRFNDKESVHPGADSSAHCPIRVQIKPADSAAVVPETSGTGNVKGYCKSSSISSNLQTLEADTSNSAKKDCWYSMNLQLQQRPYINYNNQLASVHHNYPAKELLIEALIDNLQELEIEEHPINLPRITLSDYTQKYPTDSTTASLETNSSLLSGKRRLNSILLQRQESIDLSSAKLDIPLESSDYHSEARPP